MKKTIIVLLSGALAANIALAQVPENIPPNVEQVEVSEGAPLFANPNVVETPVEGEVIPAEADVADEAMGEAVNVSEATSIPVEDEDGGFLIQDANINDIFQLLARKADKQYFHNNQLNSEEFKVTGHLNGDTSPLKQMEELAFQYGLSMYVKGNTVYAMMETQLEKLPAKQWAYSLNYLRPTDIEQIKALITPMLSPGRGIVNYEPKTNTIIIIDSMKHIEMVESLLRKIDKPKGQIVIEVKILSVASTVGQNSGVDWTSSLGSDSGVSLNVARSLNSVFGLPTSVTTAVATSSVAEIGGGNLILSPIEINSVLNALNESQLVTNKSNPIIITEDNESSNISLINRIPIITTTTTTGTTSTSAEEVRYKIDEGDSTDPETTREIGVTVSMTPSLLPDGTIRMKMRPRSAVVTGTVVGATTGNEYPEVTEATVDTIARIPNGHSLVIGGFYSEATEKSDTKVPLLGDVPIINFFFKSKGNEKVHSSLVFVVTPTSYDPANVTKSNRMSSHVNDHLKLKSGYDSADDTNPGPGHEVDLNRTLRGIRSNVLPQR
ncbi:MAG: type II secretion system protein GspD [Akkermansiaceae bacterium]